MIQTKLPTLIFTGGHHTSGLAVAQKLQSQGLNIFWFGHRHSLWGDQSDSAEFLEVRAAGIDFYDLHAGKFYKTFNPIKLIRVPYGFFQALFALIRLKQKYNLKGIITFGGYLGVPVVIAGNILGIPTISQEQTQITGWANKLIGLFAKKISISWPSSAGYYPASKVVLTGLPIRPEISKTTRSEAKILPNSIYITGGKQGSHKINSVVFEIIPELLKTFTVIHQTGSSTLFNDLTEAENLRNKLPKNLQNKYTPLPYLNSMDAANALTNSEIIISRSGAHIIYELFLLSKKCVLIPISWSSHSEQQINAQSLVDSGQAIVISEKDLTGSVLLQAIDSAKKLSPRHVPVITDGLDRFVQLIKQELL